MKAIRKNLTQPEDWWAAFEKQAAAENMTLSSWVGACCFGWLPRETRQDLSERAPAHRPPLDASSDAK